MTPYTQADLTQGLHGLGLQAGQTVMLHVSVRAVGAVMGGANTIIQSLLDLLTPAGTLMMYAGWQDIPDFVADLPPDERQAYHDHHPAFDPAIARAVRDHSILAEFFRTWPGTQRSANPEASMIANGAQAAHLTADHPLNYGYGAGSPLEKLVELGGYVLMLGAPLDTITLLHYAEFRAWLRHKQVIHYTCPIWRDGQKVWVEIEDFDTGESHDDYEFEQIAADFLAQGGGRQGKVGDADCTLFHAPDLVRFAIEWMETRFGA